MRRSDTTITVAAPPAGGGGSAKTKAFQKAPAVDEVSISATPPTEAAIHVEKV